MSTSEGKGISLERMIIIVLAVLLLFALLYIAFTMGRRTAPGAPVEEPAAEQPGAAELPPADPAEPAGEPAEEQGGLGGVHWPNMPGDLPGGQTIEVRRRDAGGRRTAPCRAGRLLASRARRGVASARLFAGLSR